MTDGLVRELREALGASNVLTGLTDRLARAHDASIYRLVPRVVSRPRDLDDVRALLAIASRHRVGVTFRAGGTSLSGQAVGEGILVELAPHFREARVGERGATITAQPGITGGRLNALLAPYRRRIGPDPASINSAMIGGIVANNASGMCCGTTANAYRTLRAVRLVLADGFVVDTSAPDADSLLRRERPAIAAGLEALRERLLARPDLADRVRRKYAIKNTMGYALNAFLDFERPLDILAHLMVGSEGTLGFVAEVTLDTVVDPPQQATALAYFADLVDAGAAVEGLVELGADVVEVMDRASLAALQTEMHYPFALTEHAAALLVEFHDTDVASLAARTAACVERLSRHRLLAPLAFTSEPSQRARYWKLRKGLFPKIGGERPLGTAVIIEDVCFPRQRLAEAVASLRALFEAHGFGDTVIFGHAKDGNLHFVLCHDFSDPAKVARYAALMEGIAALVVDEYDGSLKAEHGTGRNMAPFVEREWGAELYAIQRETKRLLDPQGILNPGVLLTDNREAHLQNLKALPAVARTVDACIECGFCERVCPSRDLTLTPRQRIAIQREIALARPREAKRLRREYAYFGVGTCAGDGMCGTVCPVGIDTGAYMRELRAAGHGAVAKRAAGFLARRVRLAAALARWALRLANLLARLGLRLTPRRIPLPAPARRLPPATSGEGPRVVHFSACLSTIMEGAGDAPSRVLARCGYRVIPVNGACCGQAFQSKGFPAAAREAGAALVERLWVASEEGRWPVVCDTSPCTARLLTLGEELDGSTRERWERFRILDFPTFVAREVIPRRPSWPKVNREVVLHPTCSAIKHDTVGDLVTVARAFAQTVTVPVSAGCCGFAGDKGFQVPELTLSATRDEGREVEALASAARERGTTLGAYTTCRTCALGMTAATGLAYGSVAELCLEALDSGSVCLDAAETGH